MAAATGRNLHTDQYLTQVVESWTPEGMIGERIAPIVDVDHQSDKILRFVQGPLFRIPNMQRARGTEAHRVQREVGTTTFFCENYALKEALTIEDRENADPVFIRRREEGTAKFLRSMLLLAKEKRWALQITSASNHGSAYVVASAWGSYSVADPLGSIWVAQDNIEAAFGLRPNHVLFSGLSWNLFSRNHNVIDKIHGTGVAGGGLSASVQEAEKLLESRVLVSQAFENTAQEGAAQAMSRIFGDTVCVYYAPLDGPSTDKPSAYYNIRWATGALAKGDIKRLPYDEKIQAQEFEIGEYWDEFALNTGLSGLIRGVNSSQ